VSGSKAKRLNGRSKTFCKGPLGLRLSHNLPTRWSSLLHRPTRWLQDLLLRAEHLSKSALRLTF
jgi:hypothetical protein